MAVKTYNPKKVIVTFLGAQLSGFAEGSFVSVESNDLFTKHIGSDGEGCRTQNADRSGSCTLTLMQSSASNDFLTAASLTDQRTSLGTGPLSITDGSGRTVVLAAEAWIAKRPNSEFSNEAGSREWRFETLDLSTDFVGGN